MKRIALLTLVMIGIFALIYAGLFVAYLQERRTQSTLQEEVDMLGLAVAQKATEARKAELEQALATAQAEQMELRYIFPTALDSTEIVAHVVDAAAQTQVHLYSVQARAPITLTTETGEYEILSYELKAEGTLADLKVFFQLLEQGPIGTITLEHMEAGLAPTPTPTPMFPTPSPTAVRRGSPTPTPQPTPTPTPETEPGQERYRITLNLQIYTRRAPTPTPTPPSQGGLATPLR